MDEVLYTSKMDDMIYTLSEYSQYIFKNMLSLLYKPVGFYLLCISLHYLTVHIYMNMCVPLTIFGFIGSPFIMLNPICSGLEWITHNSLIIISNTWMWVGLGMWVTINVLFTTYSAMKCWLIN